MKKSQDLTIILWKEDNQYVAQCLNVEVSSFGSTQEEALENINEALELYFEDGDAEFQDIEMPSITLTHLN